MSRPHPSHKTRMSDASTFDEICVNCGAHDEVPGGWGRLAEPCPYPTGRPAMDLPTLSRLASEIRASKEFYTPAGISSEPPIGVTLSQSDLMLCALMDQVIAIARMAEEVRSLETPAIENPPIAEATLVKGKLLLVVTELAEAAEAAEAGDRENYQEELADTFIRLLDLVGTQRIDITTEITKKMERNRQRPVKHGRNTVL